MKKNAHLRIINVFLVSSAVLMLLSSVLSCSNYIEDNTLVKPLSNEASDDSLLSPTASIEAPAFIEGGVPKNRKLIISFSKPMDTKSFWEKLILTDSMGKNLKEYFLPPVWSNEDTLVEIAMNPEHSVDLKNKTAFDIYVTISKNVVDASNRALSNPIDYRFRINDVLDDEKPVLVKADSLNQLVKGSYNSETEEKICSSNHIQSKASFSFEAKDSGGGEVWAKFLYKRVYDVNGNALNEPEQSKLIKLSKLNVLENYYDTVVFDLSDSKYSDGMYKIEAYASDESGNLSSTFSTYYIIRDTSIACNPNTSISYKNPAEDGEPLTKAKLDYYSNILTFENLNYDVYFTSSFGNSKKIYSDKRNAFAYTVSWGLSLSQMNQSVRILGNDFKYELPQSYKNFRLQNIDKDIYLKVTFADSVGNNASMNSVVPREIDFFNYEVQDGSTAALKKIKLNFSDLTNTSSKSSDMPDKHISISYKFYYGRYQKDSAKEAIELKQKINSGSDDNYEFEIEDNSIYLVYIQPVYTITSNTNGQFCGQTSGPLYELEVNTVSSGEDPKFYNFNVSKVSDGINTGTFTIDVEIINGESDVHYYPCFSTDGENWNTYKQLSFQIDNPLHAPINEGEAWTQSDIWKEKNLFEARETLNSSYSNVTAKVRILAVKGNKAVYSNSKELVFTQDDDNIPPEVSDKISSHDSMLSYDGRSFKFDGVIKEDDLHTTELFKYFYTDYDEKWGNNLYFMSEDQIKSLPGAVSRIGSTVSKANDSSLEYSLSPVVPVNGLKDGKYMFFARVQDTYGNESYITLGKAQIGTFKNKLKVSYDSNENQFNATLLLKDFETDFDRSMMNVQALDEDNTWYNYYGEQNELQDCILDVPTKTIYGKTKNLIEVINKQYGYKETKSKALKKGTFYRLSIQSFNDNTYNDDTKTGVNKINGKPYNDLLNATTVVPVVQNETEYDLYTEETVSNPVYYYIPAQNEDMSKFKGSFFKNTVAISSNKPVIINLISSLKDLGSDIDEWERRGKLIKTYYFKGDSTGIPFKDNDVRDDMLNSDEQGLIYYVMVVHFANNTSEISNVYKIQK